MNGTVDEKAPDIIPVKMVLSVWKTTAPQEEGKLAPAPRPDKTPTSEVLQQYLARWPGEEFEDRVALSGYLCFAAHIWLLRLHSNAIALPAAEGEKKQAVTPLQHLLDVLREGFGIFAQLSQFQKQVCAEFALFPLQHVACIAGAVSA